MDLFQKNYKCLAIPYFLFPNRGLLSSSTQIWRNVLHDFLLDTKVVPMNGRDWDIIPKFTYPMQSNWFVHFMCSLDRNPKFSPFEGMTLALQAHLFNRLYQTRGTKLKFDTHFLGPAPTGTATIALDPSVGSLGPTTNMGHVPWLYGKWNYEQCFRAGNERRKSYTKQRVDIIIYIRGEF